MSHGSFLLLSGLMLLGGCGYSLGYRAPPSVVTVAVPIFHNGTFPLRRELEYDLTAAVRTEIQNRTSLVLVDSDTADMAVKGTIRNFRERVVGEDERDRKIESRLLMTVHLLVEDYQRRKRWEETVRADEPVSVEIGETLDVARRRAIDNLAEKIVNTLDSWEED